MTLMHPWRQRLLRTPLFYKILLASLAIVALGAVAGTVITVWHVQQYPDDIHYMRLRLMKRAQGLAKAQKRVQELSELTSQPRRPDPIRFGALAAV